MSLDEDVLGGVQLTAANLQLYRHFRIPGPDSDPQYAAPNKNRWATSRGTLYCCDSEVTAWAEYCRFLADLIESAAPTVRRPIDRDELVARGHEPLPEGPIRTIYRINVELGRLADLTESSNQTRLIVAGFPLKDFLTNTENNLGLCPQLAEIGQKLGWEALKAPSAAWPAGGSTIAIFERGRANITSCEPLITGSPSIATAVGTRYRDGEKPAWIP